MGYKKMLIEMAETLVDIVVNRKGSGVADVCNAAHTAADLIELAAELGGGDDGKDE